MVASRRKLCWVARQKQAGFSWFVSAKSSFARAWCGWAEKVRASQTLESKSLAEALEVVLDEALLLECEQLGGSHPPCRRIRGTTDHGQAAGLKFDLRFGELFLSGCLRAGEAACQEVGGDVLEFPALMDGPEFQLPDKIGREIEGGLHEGSLLVCWFSVKKGIEVRSGK